MQARVSTKTVQSLSPLLLIAPDTSLRHLLEINLLLNGQIMRHQRFKLNHILASFLLVVQLLLRLVFRLVAN